MSIWPFNRRRKKEGNGVTASAPSMVAMTPIKRCAVQYLDATLAVLNREGIPLATPVHGPPARGARFIEIPINLDRRRVGPMAMRKVFNTGTLNAIQAAARVDVVNAWQVRDAIIYQYQLDRTLWRYYRRADLPSPQGIGLGVGRRLVQFSLDDKNTLVAGETRSGKSVTIETMLFAIMASYEPISEVGLVVIDPNQTLGIRKDGLKARAVGSFTNAAHLLRSLAYSHQEIHEAIDYVYAQWKHRMRNGIQGAPAIVLVIDELMSEAVIGDKEAGHYSEEHLAKLSQIASQGIKHNIFLIVGAQDPKISNTSGMLMRNLALRYIGRVTDKIASKTLSGREGVNAHLLTGNGDFVEISDASAPTTSMARFQVAEPTGGDYERLERRPVTAEPVAPVEIIDPPAPNGAERLVARALRHERETQLDASLLVPPEPNPGGNRQVEVDMRTLAIYFYEKRLSIAQADERYGIKRRVHEAHRDAARVLIEEIKWLKAGQPSRSPYYLKLQERLS
jgi:hypothetical protein